ncbi:catalase family peroxidase [Burkholderia cenocepacia]|uniref:catalase family peroxidase n=1 Tax=Burkholderia cenocepacia TaxID=95486 RepID=UPI00286F0E11|nr:catalase family peroxidase [Burkholderia cenocepacia]
MGGAGGDCRRGRRTDVDPCVDCGLDRLAHHQRIAGVGNPAAVSARLSPRARQGRLLRRHLPSRPRGGAVVDRACVLAGDIPVVGRLSIGTGSPYAADSSTTTLSMALLLKTDGKQQWRMAMNNQPYFATHEPEGFLAMQQATAPDPATGQPDPARLSAFLKAYPEAEKFMKWAAQESAPGSFAGATFYSVNAFYLVAADGHRQPVRWMMRPHDPFMPMSDAQRQKADHDFLFEGVRERLARKPLYWDYVLQLAQPGDPVDDASQPWPADRKQLVAGTLEMTRVVEQAEGACRDINFDPSIVPAGVEVSNDPILNARSGAYAHSFNRREREIGYGKATEAVGKQEVK